MSTFQKTVVALSKMGLDDAAFNACVAALRSNVTAIKVTEKTSKPTKKRAKRVGGSRGAPSKVAERAAAAETFFSANKGTLYSTLELATALGWPKQAGRPIAKLLAKQGKITKTGTSPATTRYGITV